MIDLVKILQWNQSDLVLKDVKKLDILRAGNQLDKISQLAAKFCISGKNSSILVGLDVFYSLSEKLMCKILTAPEATYRISNVERLGANPLMEFIAISSLVESDRHSESGSVGGWSAFADKYVPKCCDIPDSLSEPNWLDNTDEFYEAKVTSLGCVIDFRSPFSRRAIQANNFRPSYSTPIKMPDEMKNEVEIKICAGSDFLASRSPIAADFTRSSIKTIMPRIDGNISGYNGGSNREYIGRVNLINPQIQKISPDNIASSLVHESIHILLYVIETWRRPASNFEELYSPTRISPWTGDKIHLLAFIHASFVWYGLNRFWRDIRERTGYSSIVSDYYETTATAGFKNPGYKSLLDANRKLIHPELIDQLSEIMKNISV